MHERFDLLGKEDLENNACVKLNDFSVYMIQRGKGAFGVCCVRRVLSPFKAAQCIHDAICMRCGAIWV